VSQWVSYEMLPWNDDDFPALGAAFEEAQPHSVGPVGAGTARLFSQRRLVDFATDWISSHR
jgi:aminoglycoside 3-N-acetyltransferase